jgi:hypothetical protein
LNGSFLGDQYVGRKRVPIDYALEGPLWQSDEREQRRKGGNRGKEKPLGVTSEGFSADSTIVYEF